MKKLYIAFFPLFNRRDLWLHWLFGFIGYSVLMWFLPIGWATGIPVLIGAFKEIVWDDILGKGKYDPEDLKSTFKGVAVGLFVGAILWRII
jgi:hypothetical protein